MTETEILNGIASAYTLTAGTTRNGTTETGNSAWYAISLELGQTFVISMSIYDTSLYLFTSTGIQLAMYDGSGETREETAEFTAPLSGTFYIAIEDAGNLAGTYAVEFVPRVELTAGDDVSSCSWVDDWVLGLDGNDTLAGRGGNDTLDGGNGNDYINGGGGDDLMIGGAGNDTYVVSSAGDVVVEDAGNGIDTVISGISYTLAAGLENLTLVGNGLLSGTGNWQNNELKGSWQANRLEGKAGDDTLNGMAGGDTMIGGYGNDTYYVNSGGDVVIEDMGAGNDTVMTLTAYTLGANVENLVIIGNGTTNGIGNWLDNMITGNWQANRLSGRGGDDTIDGGAGADTMLGGYGNDIYYVNSIHDQVVESANSGYDTVIAISSWTLGNHQENLLLAGETNANGIGNSLANGIVGNDAANRLSGDAGQDILYGAAGQDTLIGGDGNDILIGGNGADTLTGSAGVDVFLYTSLSDSGPEVAARDLITDFTSGVDKIDLSHLDANEAVEGTQSFTSLIASGASFTTAGQLRLTDGVLYANTDADADAEFAITLNGVTSLSISDFIALSDTELAVTLSGVTGLSASDFGL